MDRKTTSLGLALILSAILSACATQSVPAIPFDSYSQTDVSIILAANFMRAAQIVFMAAEIFMRLARPLNRFSGRSTVKI